MKTILLLTLLLFINIFSTYSYAQSEEIQRGAYTMPYTRYEGEGGLGNNIEKHQSYFFNVEDKASEASDQQYITLTEVGSSIEWTALSSGDGITLRFSLKDSDTGSGVNGNLALYIDGEYIKNIGITSYWAWQYYPYSDADNDPINTPSDRPRMRFDELHFRLNTPILEGQNIKIVKEATDDIEYAIDFIELEDTGELIEKPEGYFDITTYGAVANDGQDDIDAFYSALYQAKLAGTGIYIPEGTFNLSDNIEITYDGIGVIGAGLWRTELFFTQEGQFKGGLMCNATNLEIGHFYMNTVNDQRFIDGAYVNHKGIYGTFGENSSIHDVWITHFETGAWIGDYSTTPKVTTNLTFTRNRIRNNYADGINLTQGTSSSIVSHCDFRSNSDDAIAIWPNNFNGAQEAVNNEIYNNTVEFNIRASGIAIFGGQGHSVHHNIVKDGFAGSGLRITTDFDGYHFGNNLEMNIYENTFIRCGTSTDLWNNHRGAIEIYASRSEIKNINFDKIDIIDAQRHAIQIGGDQNIKINFSNVTIDGTGKDNHVKSIYTNEMGGAAILSSASTGNAIFTNVSFNEIETTPYYFNVNSNFNLSIESETEKYVKGAEYLIDFGPNDGVNGDNATAQGWNNINDSNVVDESNTIISKNGDGEELTLKLLSTFNKNGKQHGGLYYPSTYIGDFYNSSATIDYFFTTGSSTLEISGLEPLQPYQFSIFASRDVSSSRITKYTFQGNTTTEYKSQTSGEGIGGTGYNGNQYNVLNSDYLFPDANGIITIEVSAHEGGYGYLNCMKITSLTDGFEKLNEAPVIEELENQLLSAGTSSVLLNVVATDVNNDDLVYEWEQIEGETVQIASSSEKETLVEGLKNGQSYTFKIFVRDNYEEVFEEVTISVENSKTQSISNFELPKTLLTTSETITLEAISTSELTVSYSSSDNEIISIDDNVLTVLKSGSVSITASQNGNEIFLPAENIVIEIEVEKASQEITFNIENEVELKTEHFELEGGSSASLPLTYTSSDESILSILGNKALLHGVGKVSITASQDGDVVYASAINVVQEIELIKSTQNIEFSLQDSINVESEYLLLEGIASSSLPLHYVSSDTSILTINKDTAFLHNKGEVVITASQEGDLYYHPADDVSSEIVIGTSKVEQQITFTLVDEISILSDPIILNGVSTSQLDITYSSSDENIILIDEGRLVPKALGEVVITAMQNGNDNYLIAEPVTDTINVKKEEQLIEFLVNDEVELRDEFIPLKGFTDSGLPLSYSSSDESILSISGDTAYLHSKGEVVIKASQAGNEFYLPAIDVLDTINVNLLDQEISFVIEDKVVELKENYFLLKGNSDSGLPLSYTSSNEEVVSISGDTAYLNLEGSVIITAIQNGDKYYHSSDKISQEIEVEKSIQEITFTLVDTVERIEEFIVLNAVSTSQLNITYTSSDESILSISGDTAIIHSIGNVEVTALQEGNRLYKEATSMKRSILIEKTKQTISFEPLSEINAHVGYFLLQAESDENLPIQFQSSNENVVTISEDTAFIHSSGTVELLALQVGNEYFEGDSVLKEISILKSSQEINFSLQNERYVSDEYFLLSGESNTGLTINYYSSDEEIISIVKDTAFIHKDGDVIIGAEQLGNNLFSSALPIEINISILKESQEVTFELVDEIVILNDSILFEGFSSSGLPIMYESSDTSILKIEGNVGYLINEGMVSVSALALSNKYYYNSSEVKRNISIYKANQTLPELSLPDTLFIENKEYLLPILTNEGLPISYTSSDPSILSITDSTIQLHSVGDIFLTVNQEGNRWYKSLNEEVHHLIIRDQVKEQETVTALGNENLLIKVFPNPSNGPLNINQKVDLIQVYSFDGRLLKTIERMKRSYNLSDLSSGSYFIMIKLGDKWIRKKWLKN